MSPSQSETQAPAPWHDWDKYYSYVKVWDCLKVQNGYAGIEYKANHTKITYFKQGSEQALEKCMPDTSYVVVPTTHSFADLVALEAKIKNHLRNERANYSISVIQYGMPLPVSELKNPKFRDIGGHVSVNANPENIKYLNALLLPFMGERLDVVERSQNDEIFVEP